MNEIVSLKDIVVDFDGERILDELSLDIHVLFCVIPMIAWAATLLAMKNYSLTGEKMKEIQAVNACRRDAVAGGMSLEDAMQKWQTLDQLPAQYRAN